MARLQVGDIKIDGQNVTIGGEPPRRVPGSGDHASVPRALWVVERLPVRAVILGAAGAVLMVAGTVVNVLYAAWADPLNALLHGGILAPLGVGLAAAAATKTWIRRNPLVRHAVALGDSSEEHLATLSTLLAGNDPRQTVAWIATRTRWPEPTILHSLALLRERGELEEELDLDQGEFYYRASQPTYPPRSLDSRLGDLTPKERV
jgi:hypothetical protein